jgi:hypothetical protein
METVELTIDENDELSGVFAISIVENPAIQENFIALSEEKKLELMEVDSERKILMGAALIPDKKILRKKKDEYYEIFFSKETVEKASQLFLKRGNQGQSTLEHEASLVGLSVVESWLVEDDVHDKSRKYGMDVPVGTWMVSMKVDNEDVWYNEVKTGNVKGFSIEAYFTERLEMSMKEEDELLNALKNIDDKISLILK